MTASLFGLLGHPVRHSVSPAMMNAAFRFANVEGVYVPFDVRPDELTDAVRGLQALGARGVNVTIPHKEAMHHLIDEYTDEARLVGAVNTLRFDHNLRKIIGHNTDVTGWWSGIQNYIAPSCDTAAILGAGGGARAVLAALSMQAPHMKVTLIARNAHRADVMVRDFGNLIHVERVDWENRSTAVQDARLVVNTTPIGMWPEVKTSPISDDGCFSASQVVQDIVYRPLATRLMEQAKNRGATVVDGLQMLIYQGAMAFEFWTGQRAPIEVMSETAQSALHS